MRRKQGQAVVGGPVARPWAPWPGRGPRGQAVCVHVALLELSLARCFYMLYA